MTIQIDLKTNPSPRTCEAVHDHSLDFPTTFNLCNILLISLNLTNGSTPAQALYANARA